MRIANVTMDVVAGAMFGQTARLNTIADNIANVDTPNFTARSVNFEDSLRSALANGTDPRAVAPRIEDSTAPRRSNGNNVAIDHELEAATEAQLDRSMMLRAFNAQVSMMRTAAGVR